MLTKEKHESISDICTGFSVAYRAHAMLVI